MTKQIEVFIQSFPIAPDIEEYRHAGAHTYCAPSMTAGIRGLSGFKGRILSEGSAELWPDIQTACERFRGSVRIHDVERFMGRLQALKLFVFKFPAVVVDGERNEGVTSAREALRRAQAE
jgi:hypothetical protein